MYTIFMNDSVIYLTNKMETESLKYDVNSLKMILKKIEDERTSQAYFYHQDVSFMWSDFKNQFNIIEAAGGVVENENEELLWIFRNDKWDLPKGKIEKEESKELAAIREVEEECGVEDLKITAQLSDTYHIYKLGETYILKITYWYKMSTAWNAVLEPQVEEGITEVKWGKKSEMSQLLSNTYKNIELLLKEL